MNFDSLKAWQGCWVELFLKCCISFSMSTVLPFLMNLELREFIGSGYFSQPLEMSNAITHLNTFVLDMHIWSWIYNQRVSYFMSGSNWPFSASLRLVHLKAEVLKESIAISLFCTFSACLVIESVCPWSVICLTDFLQIVKVSQSLKSEGIIAVKRNTTLLYLGLF